MDAVVLEKKSFKMDLKARVDVNCERKDGWTDGKPDANVGTCQQVLQ